MNILLVGENAPGRGRRGHARDTESLFQLRKVKQAEQFEAEPLPLVDKRLLEMMSPPLFVLRTVVGYEMIIEECIEVHNPVDDIFRLVPEILIAKNEIATFKVS